MMPNLDKRAGDVAGLGCCCSALPYWLPLRRRLYRTRHAASSSMALAAMSLNFLLGFTGVLSFGHAAYFGLGAYGAGMTIKYLGAEHAARHARRRRCSAPSRRR